MKDKLLLAFWGLVAGAIFVGCILGFGSVVNWINAQGSALPVSAQVFKVGLLFVIVLVLVGMGKVFLVFNRKKAREEAEKIFDAELLDAIYKAPVAKAVLEQREDQLQGLLFLPEQNRLECLNAPVYKGVTPLHVAAGLGRTKFCVWLVKYGASLDARDEAGQTPLDYAARFGKDDTLRRLQAYPGKLR